MPFVDEGFKLTTPKILERGSRIVPAAPGVYAILLRSGDRALESAGYLEANRCAPWRVDEYIHLYTGESFNICGRIQSHIYGEPAESGFQLTALALNYAHNSFWARGEMEDGQSMTMHLQAILRDEALIAFKTVPLCGDVEADIIRRSGSALNIAARPADKFTRHLKGLRQKFRREGFQHLFETQKISPDFRYVA